MTLCHNCEEIGVCSALIALGKEADYLDMPKYQGKEWNWIVEFGNFLDRIEAFGCTNEKLVKHVQAARTRLAKAQKAQELQPQTA